MPVERAMSKPTGGGVNDVTHFLASGGAPPGSPTSNPMFSGASQADWAAKRLVWVPSDKHGFEVRRVPRAMDDCMMLCYVLFPTSTQLRAYEIDYTLMNVKFEDEMKLVFSRFPLSQY